MSELAGFMGGLVIFFLGAGLGHIIIQEIKHRAIRSAEPTESIDEAAKTGEWHIDF